MKSLRSYDPHEEERYKQLVSGWFGTPYPPIGGVRRHHLRKSGEGCYADTWEVLPAQSSATIKSFLADARSIIVSVVLSPEQAEIVARVGLPTSGVRPDDPSVGFLTPWLDSCASDLDSHSPGMTDGQDPGVIFEEVFRSGQELSIEDGIENEFTTRLHALVLNYREKALECLKAQVMARQNDARLQAEALKWLGKIKEPSLHGSIRRILEEALGSAVDQIRMGAAFGLASLDDPRSRDAIKKAKAGELNPYVAHLLGKVLEQLEDTSRGTSSP